MAEPHILTIPNASIWSNRNSFVADEMQNGMATLEDSLHFLIKLIKL